KIDSGQSTISENLEPALQKMIRRHSGRRALVGIQGCSAGDEMSSAKVHHRQAKFSHGSREFWDLDSSDDPIAAPVGQTFGQVFVDAALDVQKGPRAVRTGIAGDPLQAAAPVCATRFD